MRRWPPSATTSEEPVPPSRSTPTRAPATCSQTPTCPSTTAPPRRRCCTGCSPSCIGSTPEGQTSRGHGSNPRRRSESGSSMSFGGRHARLDVVPFGTGEICWVRFSHGCMSSGSPPEDYFLSSSRKGSLREVPQISADSQPILSVLSHGADSYLG